MAREMTPQERADFDKLAVRIFNKLTVHKQDEMKHDYRADERLIAEALIATRRAALLEAVQMIEDDCYGGVDYFSDADTTLSFTDQMKRAHNKNQAKLAEQVRKLAQEG